MEEEEEEEEEEEGDTEHKSGPFAGGVEALLIA